MTTNVLVPGAGGAAAVGCLKALKMSGLECKLIATDIDPFAAGLFLADKYYIVPPAKDEDVFVEKTLEICKKEKINNIMAVSGFDTIVYAKHRNQYEKLSVNVPFSDYEVIKTCNDKFLLYERIKRMDTMVFTTLDPNEIEVPCIVKPRAGKGSRDVFVCRDVNDLKYALKKCSEPILQEFLPGREYTVDVLSDLNEKALITVPRERIETKAGIASKARIVLDKELQRTSADIAEEVGLRGGSCMQFKEGKDGRLKLIEINPRMGGTTIISVLAGVNIPEILIRLCEGEKPKIPQPKEITITRYFEDIVVRC